MWHVHLGCCTGERGSLFSIDFVVFFMAGSWVGNSKKKNLGFCYVPMPGILPVSESGQSWQSVSMVALISASCCFEF